MVPELFSEGTWLGRLTIFGDVHYKQTFFISQCYSFVIWNKITIKGTIVTLHSWCQTAQKKALRPIKSMPTIKHPSYTNPILS